MTHDMTIKASELFRDRELAINVRLVRDLRFRLGLWLIRLGFRVLRTRVNIQNPPDTSTDPTP